MDGLSRGMEGTEERSSKLEDRTIENIQLWQWRKNKLETGPWEPEGL